MRERNKKRLKISEKVKYSLIAYGSSCTWDPVCAYGAGTKNVRKTPVSMIGGGMYGSFN